MNNKVDFDNIKPPFYSDHDEIDEETFNELRSKCLKAQELAYCPYSKLKVGCCILTEDGKYVEGANVENASFGAAICAERTTIVKAVTSGHKEFKIIAISASLPEVISPCGICRQVMREFTTQKDLKMPVYLFNQDGSLFVKMYMNDLLPLSFGPGSF